MSGVLPKHIIIPVQHGQQCPAGAIATVVEVRSRPSEIQRDDWMREHGLLENEPTGTATR